MSSSAQEGVRVRHATRKGKLKTFPSHVPIILQLIRELADYEKELSSVKATEESLLATLSFATISPETSTEDENLEPISPQRTARVLLIFPPSLEQAVGLALYYHTYSTWRAKPGVYLEDLYVQPSQRGKGYGKRLIEELARLVVKIDGGRLEWSVLRWNKPSIEFYEKVIGAKDMTEWMGMRVDGDALEKLAGI